MSSVALGKSICVYGSSSLDCRYDGAKEQLQREFRAAAAQLRLAAAQQQPVLAKQTAHMGAQLTRIAAKALVPQGGSDAKGAVQDC